MTEFKRLFPSGSRQAPDPYDHFLEENGFYRKHTARDSSSLFRTISEQLYDTQIHHLSVREDCIKFMRKNREMFEGEIDDLISFESYLENLARPRVFGTKLELKAMAYMYNKNVRLFEAYNVGNWLVHNPRFIETEYFSVFLTTERHYDSVYSIKDIEKASFCQALVYEVLYLKVFKIPDVMFSVERMLHDPLGESIHIISDENAVSNDGREFKLDRSYNTYCILENYKLCHFHNREFHLFKETIQVNSEQNENDNHRMSRLNQSLLPLKEISCVRQLLNLGITPFPYKVAKALDPDIYRNIEFDSWSDARKQKRFKNWYIETQNLQVGVKCLVKLSKSQINFFNCHIQDMYLDNTCLVFVEELGEKQIVPLSSLQPLAIEHIKSYSVRARFKHLQNELKTMGSDHSKKRRFIKRIRMRELKSGHKKFRGSCNNLMEQLNNLTSIGNFEPRPQDLIAMPLLYEKHSKATKKHDQNSAVNSNDQSKKGTNDRNNNNLPNKEQKQDFVQDKQSEAVELAPEYEYMGGNIQSSYYYPPAYTNYAEPAYTAIPYDPNLSPNGTPIMQPYGQPSMISPNNSMMYYNYGPPAYQPAAAGFGGPGIPGTYLIPGAVPLKRNLLQSAGHPNLNAPPSYNIYGADIPVYDMSTVRYFYNLGHEYHKYILAQYGMQGLLSLTEPITPVVAIDSGGAANHETDKINQMTNDFQENFKIENDATATTGTSNNNYQQQSNNGKHQYQKHNKRYNNNNPMPINIRKEAKNVPANHRNQQTKNSNYSTNNKESNTHQTPETVDYAAGATSGAGDNVNCPAYIPCAPYMQYYPQDGNEQFLYSQPQAYMGAAGYSYPPPQPGVVPPYHQPQPIAEPNYSADIGLGAADAAFYHQGYAPYVYAMPQAQPTTPQSFIYYPQPPPPTHLVPSPHSVYGNNSSNSTNLSQ